MLALTASLLCTSSPLFAMDLKDAVELAVTSNPEIGEAIENRRATFQELEQARGLYLPQVDVEASIGPERRDSRITRLAGTDDDWFTRREIALTLQQLVFDGWGTDAQIAREAARVDAASFRVLERSEFIGLDVVEAYLDILRQQELQTIAADNTAFHDRTMRSIRGLVSGGVSRVADQQQAGERLEASRVTEVQIATTLDEAINRFKRLVGTGPDNLQLPGPIQADLPRTLEDGMVMARHGNPTLKLSRADVDTATEGVNEAESLFYPKATVEVQGRTGEDLNGEEGRDADLQALFVLRYNLYRGGIDTANLKEQAHRKSQAQATLARRDREVEELLANSWSALNRVRQRRAILEKQTESSRSVLGSYQSEFRVGNRALLDILDAQNESIGAEIDLATARYAERFAEYRILAVCGMLLPTLGVTPPEEATPHRDKKETAAESE